MSKLISPEECDETYRSSKMDCVVIDISKKTISNNFLQIERFTIDEYNDDFKPIGNRVFKLNGNLYYAGDCCYEEKDYTLIESISVDERLLISGTTISFDDFFILFNIFNDYPEYEFIANNNSDIVFYNNGVNNSSPSLLHFIHKKRP